MKLVLKQRLFSWFDSYDVCDEYGNAVFSVKGRLIRGFKEDSYNLLLEHRVQVKT